MQGVYQKLFSDSSKTEESKIQLIENLLSKFASDGNKLNFLTGTAEFLISESNFYYSKVELLDYITNKQIAIDREFYGITKIKEFLDKNEDNLIVTAILLNNIIKNINDSSMIHQVRAYFFKKVKKTDIYWFTVYLNEFFETKSTEKKQESMVDEKPNTKSLNSILKYLFKFFCENPNFCPTSFDMREIYLKWLLMIKGDIEKNFQKTIAQQISEICFLNEQLYISSLRIVLKALRFNYTQDDLFHCHYSAYSLIEMIPSEAITKIMNPGLVGDFQWTDSDWVRIFENFIKMGLTEKVGLSFLLLCQGFANMRSFDLLFKLQEKFVPFIIKLLKIEPYRNYSLKILIFFTLESPINTSWMSKLLDKFTICTKELWKVDQNFLKEFINLLFAIKLKYINTSIGEEFEFLTLRIIEELNLNPQEIYASKFNISIWGGVNTANSDLPTQSKNKYRGLQNLGNTCYMNSFVQALYMTKMFRYSMMSLNLHQKLQKSFQMSKDKSAIQEENKESNSDQEKKNEQNDRKKLTSVFQLQRLFALLYASERPDINPKLFKDVLPDFFKNSFAQQDSSEFGKILLDQVEQWIKNLDEKLEEIIKKFFTGEFSSQIKCHDCESVFKKSETFLDVGVHFDSIEPGLSYSLPELINKSHQDEELKDKNSYFCQKCEKHSTLAIKSTRIENYPPILIVTINRFYFDLKSSSRTKILSFVDIPEELHLANTKENDINEEKTYDLYAIIVHRGRTLDYGHYYSVAKENPSDKNWILFDDSNTMDLGSLNPFEYVKKNNQDAPYILFYQDREFTKSSLENFSNFKLQTNLGRIVEQDNVSYLKEIDQSTKLIASLSTLNVPTSFYTGHSYYKKDDDEDDNQGGGFDNQNNFNRFIM